MSIHLCLWCEGKMKINIYKSPMLENGYKKSMMSLTVHQKCMKTRERLKRHARRYGKNIFI